ncbi:MULTISPECIES: hypothetical protein [unclassified Aureimonas]|uniref:hypothetical protein n=1 Tax=unclassified Aureimonas TaxID=2615206 RepID=UPI000700333F|nr:MULTISPECIES: hypothetical protein [unclassified Aureimonas]KQT62272.1 hypothetical protein ASG62_23345 [Aureimonas sp. Leaf427]KQT72492.1 hypothetical protein ASG54_18220 [Aureimonas sp. Leaf460]
MPGPLPGIYDIMETRAKAVCSVQEIVTLVLDGKLTWKGRLAGRHDYMALMLDPEEVRRLVRREEGGGLTMIAAAAFIGMSAKSVKKFADAGNLQTVVEVNAVNRCPQTVVVRASAEAFKSTYVSLFEVAKRFDLHFLRAKTMLEEAGIVPVFDPEKFLTTVYDKSRIDAFDTSKIDSSLVDRNPPEEKLEPQATNAGPPAPEQTVASTDALALAGSPSHGGEAAELVHVPRVASASSKKALRKRETEMRVKAALAEAEDAARAAAMAYEANCERGPSGHPRGGFGFANVYVLGLDRSLWSAFREFGRIRRVEKGYWKIHRFSNLTNTGLVAFHDAACTAAAATLQKHFPNEGMFGAESYSD